MYLHHPVCISPQHSFDVIDLDHVVESANNKLLVIEPKYPDIPLNILRRMGKAVRLGVGAASVILKNNPLLDGIILGTANGGMEDCIKFLNQIIDYDEGTLTPTNFVQSTTNAIASQIGLNTHNHGYNITHVHRGLAFENALLDAMMLLKENKNAKYLVGGVDEVSGYNFNLEKLAGSYKDEICSNHHLYESGTNGSLAGEAVAMFITANDKDGAHAKVKALSTIHAADEQEVMDAMKKFMAANVLPGEQVDLFMSGENGDSRTRKYYSACESLLNETPVARFKHLCGEYPAASSFALWLCCFILKNQTVPANVLKTLTIKNDVRSVLIYNNYKGVQHGFMLVERA